MAVALRFLFYEERSIWEGGRTTWEGEGRREDGGGRIFRRGANQEGGRKVRVFETSTNAYRYGPEAHRFKLHLSFVGKEIL